MFLISFDLDSFAIYVIQNLDIFDAWKNNASCKTSTVKVCNCKFISHFIFLEFHVVLKQCWVS